MNWEPALNKVVASPPNYRIPKDAAYGQAVLRCSSSEVISLLTAWREAGYSDPDRYDYWNIGLYSGSGRSRPELELTFFWRAYMGRRNWNALVRHQMAFQAVCPRGAACESNSWSQPEFSGFTWHLVELRKGHAYWAGEIEQRGVAAHVSSKLLTEAWHESLERYQFHYTRPELAVLVQETRRRRVGDCLALSTLLAAELDECGVPAKICTGFLWGRMAGRPHSWVEAVDTDGEWKPLDLSTAVHARDFSIRDYADFGFGSLSNRAVRGQASVSHLCGGDTVQVYLNAVQAHTEYAPA